MRTTPTIRALQARLAERIDTLSAAHVQNVLMATTDRSVALALLGTVDELEQAVFAAIATRKADRIRSELAVMERRRVATEHCQDALVALLGALEANGRPDGRSSYWRPRRGAAACGS